jgi:small GTP-binding protein
MFLGDHGVGKTSIIHRACYDSFSIEVPETVGHASFPKEIHLATGETVNLAIWDTAGSEQYESFIPSVLRGVRVCLIIASLLDNCSITHIDKWKAMASDSNENPTQIILFSKTDLLTDQSQRDQLYAQYSGGVASVHFVSAKTGEGIEATFAAVAEAAMAKCEVQQDNLPPAAPVEAEDNERSNCC